MKKLTRFMVEVPDSSENTSWFIDASSMEQAADLYVAAALGERISVDLEEMEDEGRLRVFGLPDLSTTETVLDWTEIADHKILLEDLPAWQTYLAEGEGPEIAP